MLDPESPVDALAVRLVTLVLRELEGASGPAIDLDVAREALRQAAVELQAEAHHYRTGA